MGVQFLALFASEAPEAQGIAVLGIDPKAIILQAGSFLLLFFIFKKFALRGIVDTLEKRRQTIDKGVSLGIEMQNAKERFNKELQDMQHSARENADKIIMQAQQESNEIIRAGQATATQKADDIIKDANNKIEQEMKNARKQLQSEILQLVSEATEVIIDEKLDPIKDANLIQRALDKVRA